MVTRLDPRHPDPDAWKNLLADRLPPVRIHELEFHLERCPDCQGTLDELAGGESWSTAVRTYLSGPADSEPFTRLGNVDPDEDTLDFLTPSEFPDSIGRFGPYEVKGVLGRGGNGIVLKAFDGGLNRFVAVKVIASVLAGNGAARRRFAREAQAAAAVVHEHVVAVHSVDEAGGLPFIVMEYIKGRSLQDRIDRQGPLDVVEILRIGMQTASGLAAAHAQGLVHRDIKPANILLENNIERVKITDFGLARAVADASLTQSGIVTGTPQYMAPEQARGEAVDHRADLFSLGSTLYAMCAGHAAFRAESPLAVLRRVVEDHPRPLREVNVAVPVWLDAIVVKLLAKDAGERYQTAAEVADILERCLAHMQQPLTTALPAEVRRIVRQPRRVRTIRTAFAAVIGVSVVVIVGIALAQAPKADTTPEDTQSSVATPSSGAIMRPDEIEAQLKQLRDAASQLEKQVVQTQPTPIDPIRVEIQNTAQRANQLEQELDPRRK